MKLNQTYTEELADSSTKYFIIDSGKHKNDLDFTAYTWHRSKNNKIKSGDLFIYRKSQRLSSTGQFYLYGSGKFEKLSGDDEVTAIISKARPFNEFIFQSLLKDFRWEWKTKGASWSNFFGQYGINSITKNDFINLLSLAESGDYIEQNKEDIQAAITLSEKDDYYVPDSLAQTKIRPWQAKWSAEIKDNYGFKCAICNLNTQAMLVGSHVKPVNVDANNRRNPANGICLCVLHDKAFDRGLITITDENTVLISPVVANDSVLSSLLHQFDGARVDKPAKSPIDQQFLKYHRDEIYIK